VVSRPDSRMRQPPGTGWTAPPTARRSRRRPGPRLLPDGAAPPRRTMS
jgi:hypothetical protein